MKKYLLLPVFLLLFSCTDNNVTPSELGFSARENIAGKWKIVSSGFPDDEIIIESDDSTLTYRNIIYKAVYKEKTVTGTQELIYDSNNYQKFTITITMADKDYFTGSMHDTYLVNSGSFTRDREVTGTRKK